MADNAQGGDVYQNGNSKNPVEIAAQIEEQEKKEREERRRQREPPIVFTNTINVSFPDSGLPFYPKTSVTIIRSANAVTNLNEAISEE